MRWNEGYSATYYMAIVDPVTWRDVGTIQITGGQVHRETEGLRQSADVTCTDYAYGTEQYIRIYLDTRQEGGAAAHEALFTGLATSPDIAHDGARKEHSVQCYSVLKAAEDIALLRGWYAQAGAVGTDIIRQLLSVVPAPVEIADNCPRLSSTIIAEDGDTHLTMIDHILAAVGWRMKITGSGVIQILPQSEEAVARFDPNDYAMLETQIKVSADWFACPNVYLAIADDMTAIARDDRGDSVLSVLNRGREVWMQDTNADLADDESIEEYAARKLTEAQAVRREISYDRRYDPAVHPSDAVRLSYPEQDIDGIFRAESQTISLEYSARTSEELKEI